MTQLEELATRTYEPPFRHIEVTQVGGVIGAVVSGIRVFAQLLGEVTRPHPTLVGDGQVILPIDSEQGKANSWHTDVTFVDRIPAISVLPAVGLPAYGGTAVWANTVEAYRRLHPALQALAGGLRAVHSNSTTTRPTRPASAVWTSRSNGSGTSSATWCSRPSTR
jgi:alpha-ketoglutarate-dependent sulfate ester dioxygenase